MVSSIYASVKQVSDTLFSSTGNAFRKAVLIQYPHQDSWTIAFSDRHPGRRRGEPPGGRLRQRLRADDAEPDLGLFPDGAASEVVELDMTVDAALKYIVSMGVVAPSVPPGAGERRTSPSSLTM